MSAKPRLAERLLIEHLDAPREGRAICVTLGHGQLAAALGQSGIRQAVDCVVWDAFQWRSIVQEGALPDGVHVICEPDLPNEAYASAWLPTQRQGDAELTRDTLQAMYERLVPGGDLWASVDFERDTWLREQLSRFNRAVQRHVMEGGVVYRIRRSEKAPRIRDFACEFKVRDGNRLLDVRTRPGVFSHRRLDTGARCLIETVVVRPGDRILEIGCGCGVVGVAAALRAERTHLTALDSHPRAVEATRWACRQNGVASYEVHLEDRGYVADPGTYDVVVTNPPYYSQNRIAEIMVAGGLRALRPGGRLWLVTKHPDWYLEFLADQGLSPRLQAVRRYHVIEVVRPDGSR